MFRHPARFQIDACGRRFGKTTEFRGKIGTSGLSNKGWKIWYLCQSLSKAEEEFEAVRNSFKMFLRRTYREDLSLEFVTGSVAQFRSMERPDNLRGAGLHFLFGDEAAMFDPGLFDRVIRPMLADKRGRMWLASTFRGRNWFYNEWLRGIKRLEDGTPNPAYRKSWNSWLCPSRFGPAFLSNRDALRVSRKLHDEPEFFNGFGPHKFETEPCDELELIREQITASAYDQEFECKPDANQDCAFRDVAACVIETQPGVSGTCVLGWDTGKVTDPAAVVVLDSAGIVQYAANLTRGMSYPDQAAYVAQLAGHYRAAVILDATGAGTQSSAIVDMARQQFPDVDWRGHIWSRRTKGMYVTNLDVLMQQKRIRIPGAFGELIRQLGVYEYIPGNFGDVTYGAPPGDHDDLTAALCFAAWGFARGLIPPEGGRSIEARL